MNSSPFRVLTALTMLTLFGSAAHSQMVQNRTLWSVSALDHSVFIENNDQFAWSIPGLPSDVQFVADNSDEYIFFSADAMVIAQPRYYTEEDRRTPVNMENWEVEEHPEIRTEWTFTSFQWVGTSGKTKITTDQPVHEHFKYGQVDGTVIDCQAFRQLTYKNLYPGIDMVVEFHHEKGLKYKYVVSPGTDPSVISLNILNGGTPQLDGRGDLYFETLQGMGIDHKPEAWYAEDGTKVAVEYALDASNVQFTHIPSSDLKTLIIDPWVVTPGLINVDKAYDIERNPATGDIYILGGSPAHQIRKFDSAGVAQWTYTVIYSGFGGYYGDFEIAPDGDLFYSDGCCSSTVYRINENNQTIQWTGTGFGEPWRLTYNASSDQLIAAGYSTGNMVNIDPNTGVLGVFGNVANSGGAEMEEIRSITTGGDGRIYSLHCSPYLNVMASSNRVSCADQNFTTIWFEESGYLLPEEGAHYAHNADQSYCSDYQCFHGINGIVASQDYLFTCDGNTLIKRDVLTGDQVASTDVNGGEFQEVSGLVVDSCQYVYAGTHEGVNQYNSDLEILNTYTTDGDVYDMVPGYPGEMIVCGWGFVASLAMDCGLFAALQGTNPECAGDCTGTINLVIFGGDEPYTIEWDNGSNAMELTGLCAGTYSVTVTDAGGNTDTQEITITEPSPLAANGSSVQPDCHNGCDGSATASGNGGTPGYSYTWDTTPVQNTATANGLCAGSYTCTVTDANGCTFEKTVEVTEPAALNVAVVAHTCTEDLPNGYAVAAAGGGTAPYSYLWGTEPPQAGDTAVGLYTGSYQLFVTDAHGCIDSALAIIPICYDTLFIPNIFTPNNDNTNQTFLIYNKGYSDFHCLIYNRWGQQIYEWSDGSKGWNGKTESGDLCAEGVYYFVFTATHYTGEAIEKSGYFHLVGSKN